MAFYPKLDGTQFMQFKIVVENMLKDDEYLKGAPYDKESIQFISGLRPPDVIDLFGESEGAEEMAVIDSQLKTIINDIEAMAPTMVKAETKEKIDYYKAKTSLYDKLLSMRERANSVKEMYDFRNTILGFMHEELTKDQITALMKRLDGAV